MEQKTITIYDLPVPVTTPFLEGHVCNAAEAKTLNQGRIDNLRAAIGRLFKDLKDEAAENGTEFNAEQALAAAAKLDAEYVFTMTTRGGRTPVDPVQAELRSLAKDNLLARIRQKGKTYKQVKDEKGEAFDGWLETALSTIMQDPELVKRAKRNVELARASAEKELDGLDF